jgi:hypothetical protein
MTDLTIDNSQLRKVILAGGARSVPGQKTQRDAQFFWSLLAAAPYFGRQNTFDKFGNPSGVNADHVYPLRVLAADQPRAGNAGGPPWRRPRLIDLHLLVGASNDAYAERAGDNDSLAVSFSKGSPITAAARSGAVLQTFPETGKPPAVVPDAAAAVAERKAPFVRTVVEPLPADDNQWPVPSSNTVDIDVPPFRLVAGRVGLRVAIVDDGGHPTQGLAWLDALGIDRKKQGKAVWGQIWLVPDGIEFDAVIKTFPGSSEPLTARVLLAADENGKFHLNLLSVAKEAQDKWRQAWTRITPAVGAEDDLLGLKFASSHDGSTPGFRWAVKLQNGVPNGIGPLEIPQDALRIELVSPSENGDIDGVARLATGWVTAKDGSSAIDKTVEFTFASPAAPAGASNVKIHSLPLAIEVDFGAIASLGIHADRLASDLRSSYGLETPPPIADDASSGPAFARPLLPAFVPLADGWLQLPVPNLGPLDTGLDINLAVRTPDRKPSVFGDGFFRLKRLGLPPGVLSVNTPFGPGTQAPWAITITDPVAASGKIVLERDSDPQQPGHLGESTVTLNGFNISARGLIWVSADRPDALEALPRLSAGPGSFIDLAFESDAKDLLQVSLSALKINATRGHDEKFHSDPMVVEKVDLAIDFNVKGDRWIKELLRPPQARAALSAALAVVDGQTEPKAVENAFAAGNGVLPWSPVVWQHHRAIPLAAAMPMTRVAAGAVRPLESRDLIPYALETKAAAAGWQRLVTLGISNGKPFAEVRDGGLRYKLISSWPNQTGDTVNPDRGIAFAALGLPGVELRPLADPNTRDALSYQAALRFDLPALDEAFATAPLPPQPGGPASAEERDTPPPKPVATALDWPLLAEFWGDQERKHQNSRVADSYMMPFRPVDASAEQSKVDVTTLVRGLTWSDVTIQVGTKPVADRLPYGSLSIDNGAALSGNEVLKGYSGKFTPNVAAGTLRTGDGPLDVLGFSPATFKYWDSGAADEYFDLDNRLTGIKPPAENPVGILSRQVFVSGTKSRLVSLLAPVSIQFEDANGTKSGFQFWFKDVLFKDNAALLDGNEDISFDIWDDAAKLAGSGFEWRLVPADPAEAEAVFRLGRNQMPFFGFRLEPLRLKALSLNGDQVATASILCRLTLGEVGRSSDPSLNVVTLNLTFNQGRAIRATFDNGALQFAFAIPDKLNPQRQRLVAVTASVKPSTGTVFDLAVVGFSVEVAGVGIEFGSAAIEFTSVGIDPRRDTVSFTAGAGDLPLAPGKGRLRINSAKLTAALEVAKAARQLNEVPTSLDLTYSVEVAPRGDTATSPTGIFSFTFDQTGAGSFSIFGQKAAFPAGSVREGDEALVIAVPGTTIASSWNASLGFAARLGKSSVHGVGELQYGQYDADVASSGASFALATGMDASDARLIIALSAAGAGADWKGTATISGKVTAQNAINWPSIDWKTPTPTIPLPLEPKENNGRVTVKPNQTTGVTSHSVTWIFSEHRIDLALAAALAAKSDAALWSTIVTARHELTRGDKTLKWVGVETIAVGYPASIIPKIPLDTHGAPALETDSTTFAARYKGRIRKSDYNLKVEPGMHRPGLGAVATVLQGALGSAFRTAFWKTPPDNVLMVVGGFLGALRLGGEDAAPLLRLPVLAGLAAGTIKQAVPTDGIELSWTDGPAAQLIALTRPGAPSPADASLDALRSAVLAGSLPMPPFSDGTTWDDPAGAVLVEQSFVNADLTSTAALGNSPFFVASAVTVERIFRLAQTTLPPQIEALSLVAGASLLRRGGKKLPLSLAAALILRDRDLSPSPRPRAPHVVLVGQRLTVADWTGPSAGESDATWIPVLNGVAVARDSTPRVAVVAVPQPLDAGSTTQYLQHAFPSGAFDVYPATASSTASFADHGRGPAAITGNSELRWLAPVVEGAGEPIRDDDVGERVGSGLAGLTRRNRLPAHTGTAIDLASPAETANDDFVWLSQTQVPIYLPLKPSGLRGPSMGALTPATPQPRLPVGGDVLQAILASSGDDGQKAGKRSVQPFLPQELSAASVGERAGVMTARRARLLSGLGTITTFDPMYSRFGRPAQAGSSFARQLRTPRPARLPKNTGDILRDRRIEASSVEATKPAAAVIGTADLVEGEYVGGTTSEYQAWSIRAVAAPEWESTVSDRWDGTIRLACRMFVVSEKSPEPSPLELLGRALIEGTAGKLETRGTLKIGNAAIPFSRVAFRAGLLPWSASPNRPNRSPNAPTEPPKKTFYADIDVILISKVSVRGVADPDIAAAFSSPGPLPAAEVQWTVHPSSERAATVVAPNVEFPLTIADPNQPELAHGNDRAPVTLRMPLYPVIAIRGALPLTPATLLFTDPAYNRDLAGPPASDGKRLELTEAARKLLPAGRGDLKLVLSADRNQLTRRGTVTFMLDVRFERPMDDVAQSIAENAGVAPGGDLAKENDKTVATMRLELQPKGEPSRPLCFARDKVALKLGTVYELPLAALAEVDGTPARLSPGDILVMETALNDSATAVFWNSATGKPTDLVDLLPTPPTTPNASSNIPACSLRFVLTDDPVIEPPPALYATLLRTGTELSSRLSVPLHAQSPLPWRVDLVDPARDFRHGMMRRHASFVWTLVRPRAEFKTECIYVIKADRNGQTYLPEEVSEFLVPEVDGAIT